MGRVIRKSVAVEKDSVLLTDNTQEEVQLIDSQWSLGIADKR